MESRSVVERELAAAEPRQVRSGPLRRVGRAVATFLLGGLTTIEVMAVAIGTVAFMALLWASHTVEPERLITGAGFRAAWILLVLGLIRPVTWIPYLLLFVAFRRLFDALMPGPRAIVRNALANLVTIAILAGILWLVVASIEGGGTAILSGLAFATGSGSFDGLWSFRGDWTAGRVGLVIAMVIVVRLFLPPLGRDLDRSHQPILGFAEGARGTFDRYFLLVVVAASFGVGLVAYLIGRS